MRATADIERRHLDRAANVMCAWLLEHVHDKTHQELCELHPDTWREAAEVAIRAGRGEFDARPFIMRPELQGERPMT